MKANELQINTFLQAQNVQFIIPIYQRNYDWTTNECKELFNDIIAVDQEERGTHFIGSIVFIHEGTYSTSEVRELVIIDGQQRLTTINILYVALYRFAKDNQQQTEADMLFNMFLINQYVQQESSKLKLKQTDNNSLAFKAIMNNTENEFGKYSNVIENFKYFRDRITPNNFQSILNGLKRLMFVEISLERDKDDPQRIFESLNSTGLDLSQSDLIRNYILMDLDPKDQNQIFDQIWSPIEENARDLTKQKSMVSDFIRDYLTLKNKKIPNKSKVYLEFKKIYSDKKDSGFYEELEHIKSLSAHYKKFINPNTVNDLELRKELEYIARLEINVAFPFLLQVFEDADKGIIEKDTLIKVLKLVQSFTWRRFIFGLPTNALNQIFMTLYSEVDTEDYYESIAYALVKKKGVAKFPTDADILSVLKDRDLYNIKAKNRKYMFEMLENYNNREYVDTTNEHITIEHIFPQNPNEDWNDNLSQEEFFVFKEKYLNTIANLTLSGNNGALSNKSFSSKKSMNIQNGEQGYKYSRLWLNSFLKEIDLWNEDNYKKRLSLISERFLAIWKYPSIDVSMTMIGETPEQSIFEVVDSVNKKLNYFIYENTKIEEEAVSKMYYYILEKLYNDNAQLMINQSIIKLTSNSSEFTESYEVFNGYYIDPRANNTRKFRVLKELLKLFGKEDELLIKFSENEDIEISRLSIRRNFWKQLLPQIENTELFKNVNPTKDHWISTGAGISGLAYSMAITKTYARIELTISSSDKIINKYYFNQLFRNKKQVEEVFGKSLIWEELHDKKMSRIKYQLDNVNLFDDSDWNEMSDFLLSNLPNFEKAFNIEIENFKRVKNLL